MMNKNMKKDNKGFSLVELIIVIAIMAILIGVVALQVIPYLEKSRVGKDKQTVDTVYSAFQSAIAATDGAGAEDITFTVDKSTALAVTCTDGTVATGVEEDMKATLGGDGKAICGKLSSKNAVSSTGGNYTIQGKYDKGTKKITVYVKTCLKGESDFNSDSIEISSSNQ